MTFGCWSLKKLISSKLINLCTASPITYFHLLLGDISNVSDIHYYHKRSSENLRGSRAEAPTARTNSRRPIFAIKCVRQ